jgi:DNA-binding NarL/FixJ family response regulator
MTGPRPAGRPWTRPEDRRLLEMVASGMTHALISRELKRTLAAVQSRANTLKKKSKSNPPENP